MSKMNEKITATTNGMLTEGQTGNHTIIIDEPERMGGTDQGANPLGALLISLAGCENVVANFVAKEIQFDLKKIDFNISGELDTRGMMGEEGVRPYFQKVSVRAKVETTETEERVKELQELVDSRCPVFTTLKAANVEMDVHWEKA